MRTGSGWSSSPHSGSAPAPLTVIGSNTITLVDVIVGEVWLGSGQSNLDSPVNMYVANDPVLKEAANKKYPMLRLLHVYNGIPHGNTGWQGAGPGNVGGFSAQLFYFGMKLQQELGVPVGLIEAAVAGSPSGPFLSQSAFNADPEIQKAAARADARNPLAARMKEYEAALAKWQKETAAAKAAGTPENRLPRHPGLPVPYARQMTGNSYEKLIRPLIPYAIRGVLWDQGEGGAVDGPIWQPTVMAALIRSWRADWGQGEFPWLSVQKPSGGGCALTPDNPMNTGAMAFASLPKDPPPTEYFASLRQDGYRIMRNPNTFLVINSDLAPGVHPPNKSGYGARDVRVALGAVYGKPVEYYGPVFQSFQVEGSKVRISYSHLGRGLTVPPGQPLQGFCVAWRRQEVPLGRGGDRRPDDRTVKSGRSRSRRRALRVDLAAGVGQLIQSRWIARPRFSHRHLVTHQNVVLPASGRQCRGTPFATRRASALLMIVVMATEQVWTACRGSRSHEIVDRDAAVEAEQFIHGKGGKPLGRWAVARVLGERRHPGVGPQSLEQGARGAGPGQG